MSIPANNVSIGDPTKKSHYDALYDNAILADTGGTAGGAQTIPGHKTFSSGLNSVIEKSITQSSTVSVTDRPTHYLINATSTVTVSLYTATLFTDKLLTFIRTNSATAPVNLLAVSGDGINQHSTVYLINKYDRVSLYSYSSGWIIVEGPKQPVSREPSLGTPHSHFAAILNLNPRDTDPHTLDLSGEIPPGAGAVAGFWGVKGNAGNLDALLYDASGGNLVSLAKTQVANQYVFGRWFCSIAANRTIAWVVGSAAIDTLVVDMTEYYI